MCVVPFPISPDPHLILRTFEVRWCTGMMTEKKCGHQSLDSITIPGQHRCDQIKILLQLYPNA